MESNGQLFLDNIHSFIESNKILNLLYTFFLFILSYVSYGITMMPVYYGLGYHLYCNTYTHLYYKIKKLDIKDKGYEEGKIISWNIHYGTDNRENPNLDKMVKYLNEERPHIVMIQEMITIKDLDFIDLIASKLHMKDYYFEPEIKFGKCSIGKLILSRTHIKKKNNIKYEKCLLGHRHNVLMATIRIKRKEYLFCNLHLHSDVTGNFQSEHLNLLLENLDNKKHNNLVKVICGDFNMLPFWKLMKNVKVKYNEFINNNYTYPANYPLVKLDYAFISKNNDTNNYNLEILESQLSDHKPICFYL